MKSQIIMSIVSFLLLLPPQLKAAGEMTLPGAACQHRYPNGFSSGAVRPSHSGVGWVGNPDDSEEQVFLCPIVRDNHTSKPTDLEVYVYDAHDTEAISCQVVHTYINSGTIYTVYGTADTSSNNYDTMTPSFPGTEVDYHAYGVFCTVPPVDGVASRIEGYWWDES